jgi:dihydroflavonol-4-reductase
VAIGFAAVDEAVEGRLLGREPLAPLDGALMARKRMFVDGSRAVRELGIPQSSPRAALADAIDWFRARARSDDEPRSRSAARAADGARRGVA